MTATQTEVPELNKHRMHKRRFPHDDLLSLTVVKAYDAIHELNVHVHYLSCSSCVSEGRRAYWHKPCRYWAADDMYMRKMPQFGVHTPWLQIHHRNEDAASTSTWATCNTKSLFMILTRIIALNGYATVAVNQVLGRQ